MSRHVFLYFILEISARCTSFKCLAVENDPRPLYRLSPDRLVCWDVFPPPGPFCSEAHASSPFCTRRCSSPLSVLLDWDISLASRFIFFSLASNFCASLLPQAFLCLSLSLVLLSLFLSLVLRIPVTNFELQPDQLPVAPPGRHRPAGMLRKKENNIGWLHCNLFGQFNI